MNNSNPPVIWQLVHQRHFTKEFNIVENIKRLNVALTYFPFPMPERAHDAKMGVLTLGLFFQNRLDKNEMVTDIMKNSWAENNNIKVDYIFKSIKDTEVKFKNIKIKGYRSGIELLYFFIPEILISDYQ